MVIAKGFLFDNKTRVYFLCPSIGTAGLEWWDQHYVEERSRNLYLISSFAINGCGTISKSFNLL